MPAWVRGVAVAAFAAAGAGVAWAAQASLGDATWSVSTGIGACLAAAVYEVLRLSTTSSSSDMYRVTDPTWVIRVRTAVVQ